MGKFIETEGRIEVTSGWGRENENLSLNGYRVSVSVMKKFWKDRWWLYNSDVLNANEMFHLMVNFLK